MLGVVFLCTTGMTELLIAQLILMLFKVLYFDVLKYTFSHFQAGMHIIISPIKEEWRPFQRAQNNSPLFKRKFEYQRHIATIGLQKVG